MLLLRLAYKQIMNSADFVKAKTVKKFWDAYRACVEAHHTPPQRSGYYVLWGLRPTGSHLEY